MVLMVTGAKDTFRVSRHKKEVEEIDRIIKNYSEFFNMEINKLEASVVLAERSRRSKMNSIESKQIIAGVRGL